jgi:hypothetical protein
MGFGKDADRERITMLLEFGATNKKKRGWEAGRMMFNAVTFVLEYKRRFW